MPQLHTVLVEHRSSTTEPAGVGPVATVATLDRAALDALRGLPSAGGGSLIERVIDVYLLSSAELVTKAEAAARADDGEALRAAAHALKSSSGNVGASRLAALCAQIEKLVRNADLLSAASLVEELVGEHRDVCAALKSERAVRSGEAA
jgi:HPt (histidine-containing phosphotransfer) domain-containing protein